MGKMLRWKLALIAVVLVAGGTIGVYPVVAAMLGRHVPTWLADQQLKLGLDLKGGVHLVVRVQTDYALRAQTDSEADRLRDALDADRVSHGSITTIGPTTFRVDGILPDQDVVFRQVSNQALSAFERSAHGDGPYLFSMKPTVEAALRDDAVIQAREAIERRINALGVAEPSIAREGGAGDQLLIQLPGVTNVTAAKHVIQTTGVLEFRLVEAGPAKAQDALVSADGVTPRDSEILPGLGAELGDAAFYVVRRVPVVTGRDLRNARPTLDENNQPAVAFTLTAEGGRKFGKATAENIGHKLAIVLDGRVQSTPWIESRITTDGSIHGGFSQQEAQDLALILRAGALPAPVTYLEERTIGPSLGADSVHSGIVASVLGLLLIVSFMLAYYRLSGVNAIVALAANLTILLGLMAYIGAVMTLPGIAGFVLTMGIGVDSNVLIFERIKEELETQRGVRAAIDAGFSRVFLTLLDTHVAALIAAGCLFQFGTGPIRGFAVTLSIGLMSNLFTSTFLSKTLYEMAFARKQQITTLSI